jgi:hypothetical protein
MEDERRSWTPDEGLLKDIPVLPKDPDEESTFAKRRILGKDPETGKNGKSVCRHFLRTRFFLEEFEEVKPARRTVRPYKWDSKAKKTTLSLPSTSSLKSADFKSAGRRSSFRVRLCSPSTSSAVRQNHPIFHLLIHPDNFFLFFYPER